MSTPDHQQVLAELEAVRTRLAELESTERNRSLRRKRVGVAVAVATFAFVGTALAANGNCPNDFPFCFAPDTPAQAAQVNHNFSQIQEWLEGKVGTRTTSGVQTASVSTTGDVTSGGTLRVNNGAQIIGNGTGAFHLNTLPTTGTMYLNWHSGSGGVIVGNGSSGQSVHLQGNGNVNLTTINGRRPPVVYTQNCSTASCSLSCGNGGVIRQAWGTHGFRTDQSVGGSWACGAAVMWMGACIGQSSCTITTGCSSSGLWIDCW